MAGLGRLRVALRTTNLGVEERGCFPTDASPRSMAKEYRSAPGAHSQGIGNVGHARGRPGRLLGLIALGPRTHLAPKSHFCSAGIHCDVARIDFGAPFESLLALQLDIGGPYGRHDGDMVSKAQNPIHA